MFLPSVSTYPFLDFFPFLLNRNHSRHTSHIQKEIIKLVNKLYRSGRGNLICFQLSSAIKLDVKTQFNQATGGKVTTGKSTEAWFQFICFQTSQTLEKHVAVFIACYCGLVKKIFCQHAEAYVIRPCAFLLLTKCGLCVGHYPCSAISILT